MDKHFKNTTHMKESPIIQAQFVDKAQAVFTSLKKAEKDKPNLQSENAKDNQQNKRATY